MNKKLLGITAVSPEELSAKLSTALSKKHKYQYLSLAISGPKVLVNPFTLPSTKIKSLKTQLKLEAVELLNLPADNIAFDFQIFSNTKKEVSGIFVCMPQELLQNYLFVIKQAKLIPLKVTAYILASINSFIKQNNNSSERFSLIDFSRENYVNLAVINNHKFELLRKVPYESLGEAKFEVIRSLRSACARSHIKHFDHIYFSGDLSHKEDVISDVENIFSTKIETKNLEDVENTLVLEDTFFSINLLRNIEFSLKERKSILLAINLMFILSLAGCAYLGYRVYDIDKYLTRLTKLKKSFNFGTLSQCTNYALQLNNSEEHS